MIAALPFVISSEEFDDQPHFKTNAQTPKSSIPPSINSTQSINGLDPHHSSSILDIHQQ
jgi:hypothetical protein